MAQPIRRQRGAFADDGMHHDVPQLALASRPRTTSCARRDDASPSPQRYPASARGCGWSPGAAGSLKRRAVAMEACEVRPPLGLPNLGNTCYMGAVLQCLLNTPGRFRGALQVFGLLSDLQFKQNGPLRLCCALAHLAEEYDCGGGASGRQALVLLKESIGDLASQFASCDQQDAYEFLGCLLDGLNDGFRALYNSVSRAGPKEGVIRSIFGVATYSVRKCLQCAQRVEADHRTDTALGLPLVSNAARLDPELRREEDARPIALEDLIEEAREAEIVEDYACDNCAMLAASGYPYAERSRLAMRSGLMSRAGDVLVICLYRFLDTVDEDGDFSAVKLRRPVLIPTELSLPVGTYSLYGAVSHCGEELSSGHYIAAVRSPDDDLWYECDDSSVDLIRLRALYDGSEVIRFRYDADPFILFYHRTALTE